MTQAIGLVSACGGRYPTTLGQLAQMTSGYADYVASPEMSDAQYGDPFRQWTPDYPGTGPPRVHVRAAGVLEVEARSEVL